MDTTNYVNPNKDYFNTPVVPPTSTTIDATKLSTQNAGFQLPPTPIAPSYDISSIPTINDIVETSNAPTVTEQKQTSLSDRLLGAITKLGGQKQAQANAEAAVGLPTFKTQLNDANATLQTLQKESAAIPLQLQQDATGRGITAGGLAPIQTAALRNNAIKALGVSAIAQTLQGNIALAQEQANKAVELEFAPIQSEIDYLREALTLNEKQLSREDNKKAQILSAKLDERQRLLDTQKEDKGIIYGWASEAARLGNAPQAVVNQALAQTDPKQALALLAPYLQDTIAKEKSLADLAYTRAQTNKLNADAAKVVAETKALNPNFSIDMSKVSDKGKALLSSVANLRYNSVEESNRIRKNIAQAVANGDIDGAEQQLKQFGYEKLSSAQKTDFDLYENAVSAFGSAAGQLATSNLEAGPYKSLAEKAKPWASIQNDKQYADLRGIIELGQAQIRKGFYGTAVTDSEAANARNFLITNNDSLGQIKWKLDNGRNFLRYVNDATISRNIGLPKPNVDDYLTYRVQNKAGQTGTIPRSEYNPQEYTILSQ